MRGRADSLNLAVATGVMLFEIRRGALKLEPIEGQNERCTEICSPYARWSWRPIALDQWIKYLVETGLALQEKVELVPFLALYRTYNTGIAFSMFASFGDIGLIVVAVCVVAFVLLPGDAATQHRPRSWPASASR